MLRVRARYKYVSTQISHLDGYLIPSYTIFIYKFKMPATQKESKLSAANLREQEH